MRNLFLRHSRHWLQQRSFRSDSSRDSSFFLKRGCRAYSRSRIVLRKREELGVSPPAASVSRRNKFVEWYLGLIEKHPVPTKSVTASSIFLAADVCSQMITHTSSDSFDSIRTLRMAGYGLLISGPTLHLWFNFISKVLPMRDLLSTFKKMILGQTVYGPIMTVAFFSVNAGLQGETGPEILARLKRDLLPTFRSGLVYWPACDYITFKFIPVRLQPLVSNSFSFVWTIYITYMASLKKVSKNEEPAD